MKTLVIASLLVGGAAFAQIPSKKTLPLVKNGALSAPADYGPASSAPALPSAASGVSSTNTTPIEGIDDKNVLVGILPTLPQVTPGKELGRWGVGNGGDSLRIGFARARDYAANVVLRIKPNSLNNIQDQVVRDWIITNQKFLAADILQTEHIWTTDSEPTCAWTVMPGDVPHLPVSNPIQFSYPTCRDSAPSFLAAAQILIHESVHHFNGDETTADKVAIGILDAWRSGNMDAVPVSLTNAPVGTEKHAAVWTGSQMVLIGGTKDDSGTDVNSISSYDPRTDAWRSYAVPQNFAARHDAQAIWTGTQVFIWGGFHRNGNSDEWTYDGALFDPANGAITVVKAPSFWAPKSSTWDIDPRQTLVWTGDKAIVWGGVDGNGKPLGAIFDPKTQAFSAINTTSPYAPQRIAGHSAVWTGSQMIIWGGYEGSSDASRAITNEGSVYNPADDSWLPITTTNAPAARAGQQAVWTGSKLIVISGGGVSSRTDLKSTGGQYDPATQSWTNYTSELMVERVGHKAVWNGEEVLVVGGRSNRLKTYFGEVYAFNPDTQKWRILSSSQTPEGRSSSSIVWTGSSAIVWGGQSADQKSERTGGVYYP